MADPPPRRVAGQRALQQDERRRRLIRAARDLLAEENASGFSMAALAARAGVSLATPYNLFGSKAAILQAVFAADVAGLHRMLGEREADPVTLVLGSVDLLAGAFVRRPAYYRALSRSIAALGPNEVRQFMSPIADTILRPAVDALQAAGLLRLPVPTPVIGTQLALIFESAFMHWQALDWTAERLTIELRIGFAIVLLGLVTQDTRVALERIISETLALPGEKVCYKGL